ncbi:MAG: methyltransferase domain-containing protein [Thermoplasmata archaeon]|nr:MAG: methyltransferase domain-containing protein [Thermoplasmata archaeon]
MPEEKEDFMTTEDWIKKLKHQAEDSREYRHKLYEKVDLKSRKNILDVGCGTGAVTLDIAQLSGGEVIGIDIDPEKLEEARRALADIPNVKLMEGDVVDLPFEDEIFDLVVFNIVLMHVKEQQRAVDEMARVTQKGGYVLGSLEPDYASKIDYPEDPATPLILNSIEDRGSDIYAGRKLKTLFNRAGLETQIGMDTESDFLLVRDNKKYLDMYLKDFWMFEKLFKKDGWTDEEIESYKSEEIERINKGLSFHFIPSFYAIGRKLSD